MDRADLTIEVGGKPLEQRIRDSERMPKARNGVAVVAAMNRIDIATDRIFNLHRHWVDPGGHAERVQRLAELLKELSHRNGTERDLADFPEARAADRFVR